MQVQMQWFGTYSNEHKLYLILPRCLRKRKTDGFGWDIKIYLWSKRIVVVKLLLTKLKLGGGK